MGAEEQLLTVSNPGSTVSLCATGGGCGRRRLTLAPGAAVWRQASAATMEKDLAELKTQGALVAESLKAMNETLRGLSAWMPQVDTSITAIQKSIDAVASRVTALEAVRVRSPDDDQMPRPNGHHQRNNTQGPDSDVIRAPFHALVKGTKKIPHTPVHFEMGEQSGKDSHLDDSSYTNHSTHRDWNYSRMPKTDFPRFDGENPKWWKTVCEKYFNTYEVDRHSWASFATMHFHGNAALWLTNYEEVNEIETWEELVVG